MRRIGQRVALMGVSAFGLACLALASTPRGALLVWNASACMPRGLYLARPVEEATVGDVVTAWLPDAARDLAAARHYLPVDVPALKRVRAVAGATVCAADTSISIDGVPIAARRLADGLGRPLPTWSGCQTLTDGQIFLLSEASADSFDGRYFGPISSTQLIAKVRPLWTY